MNAKTLRVVVGPKGLGPHPSLTGAGCDAELIIAEGASHVALTDRKWDGFALMVELVTELASGLSL